MGINNRQRRAAKAKRRARDQHADRVRHQRSGRADASGRPRTAPFDAVRALLSEATNTPDSGHRQVVLEALMQVEPELVDAVAEAQLLSSVDLLWRNGWQPDEVVRHARRCDARTGRLVATAVAADHVDRPASTLHPRWAAQVEALAPPHVAARTGWLAAFADAEVVHRSVLVATTVNALRTVCEVGPIHQLLPPPGAGARHDTSTDSAVDAAVLTRIRALLAQAESTSFEAEADAFTAKAEELMARHAIDEAVLWAASGRRDRPISARIVVDDPYADVKSLLLQHVARHCRCRSVWHDRYAWSAVVGFPTDVAATELLFTSLLVQASTALQAEAARAGPGGRTRSRSFRSSFLVAFADRIDQRFLAISAAAEAASDGGSSALLPILAARDDAVAEEVEALFGTLRSSAVRRANDTAGWARGALAADLAQLDAGDLRAGPT